MSCIRAFQWLMCRCWVPPGCLIGRVLDASLHPGCLAVETKYWHISTSPASKRLPSVQKQGDAARTSDHSHMVCCSTLRHCLSGVSLSCRYREFIADETRRKWEWQCRHEDEAAFWTSVVNGIIGNRHPALYLNLTFRQRAAVVFTCLPTVHARSYSISRAGRSSGDLVIARLASSTCC